MKIGIVLIENIDERKFIFYAFIILESQNFAKLRQNMQGIHFEHRKLTTLPFFAEFNHSTFTVSTFNGYYKSFP